MKLDIRQRQLEFPFSAEDPRRMMPIEFIGAALFSALNRSAPPVVLTKMTELGRMNGYMLVFKGRVLTQAHADVWLAVIEIMRRQNKTRAGTSVAFHAGQVLRMLGKAANSDRRQELYEAITDMSSCTVHIYKPGSTQSYFGPMLFGKIDKLIGGEVRYEVMLHPVLCEAFIRGYVGINWLDRKAIGKNELALWLHQYLIAFPAKVSLAELQQLSAQSKSTPKEFRRRIRHAMELLSELRLIGAWKIDKDDIMSIRLPRPALR